MIRIGYHPWAAHQLSITSGPTPSKEEHYRSLLLEQDPKLVSKLSREEQEDAFQKLLPCLKDPVSLDDYIEIQRSHLLEFPQAMVGEVGLDRSARLPYRSVGSGRDGLSPFKTPIRHQLAILEAQLDLAVELRRNVSFHSVDAQSITVDVMKRMKEKHGKKWLDINVDMHSCGLSVETWKDIEVSVSFLTRQLVLMCPQRKHTNVFMSLSTVINSRSPVHRSLIAVCSPDRILSESDYNHIGYTTRQTWNMIRTIAEVKGWPIEEAWDVEPGPKDSWGVVRRLENNWSAFQQGSHKPAKQ